MRVRIYAAPVPLQSPGSCTIESNLLGKFWLLHLDLASNCGNASTRLQPTYQRSRQECVPVAQHLRSGKYPPGKIHRNPSAKSTSAATSTLWVSRTVNVRCHHAQNPPSAGEHPRSPKEVPVLAVDVPVAKHYSAPAFGAAGFAPQTGYPPASVDGWKSVPQASVMSFTASPGTTCFCCDHRNCATVA